MTAATTIESVPSIPATKRLAWYERIPPPYYSATLITLILVIGQWQYNIIGGYPRLIAALSVALVTEVVLSLWLRKKFPFVVSAYISGNSVAILTKPLVGTLWPFYLGSFIAIASKYVLAIKGRHLWNPTNFSISIFLLIAPNSMAVLSHQWSNSPIAVAIIYAVGAIVCWRAKVLHLTGTYLIAFPALMLLRCGFDLQQWRTEIATLTGPMYTLFMFFMVTDPKTIVSGKFAQVVICVLTAVVDVLIRVAGDHDLAFVKPLLPAPPLFALFIVGPIALWWSIATGREKPRTA